MESPDENKDPSYKKLIDDKQTVNDPFFCANFFQCIANCCFLLSA